MNKEQVMGIVRHILTGIGSVLVAKGVVDAETVATGAGAIVTLGGLIWSFVAKRGV